MTIRVGPPPFRALFGSLSVEDQRIDDICKAVQQVLKAEHCTSKELLQVLQENKIPEGIATLSGDIRKAFIKIFGGCLTWTLKHGACGVRNYLEKEPLVQNILINNPAMRNVNNFYISVQGIFTYEPQCSENDVLWILKNRLPIDRNFIELDKEDMADALSTCLLWAWDNNATQVIELIRKYPLYHQLIQERYRKLHWAQYDDTLAPILREDQTRKKEPSSIGPNFTAIMDKLEEKPETYIRKKVDEWLSQNTKADPVVKEVMGEIRRLPENPTQAAAYILQHENQILLNSEIKKGMRSVVQWMNALSNELQETQERLLANVYFMLCLSLEVYIKEDQASQHYTVPIVDSPGGESHTSTEDLPDDLKAALAKRV